MAAHIEDHKKHPNFGFECLHYSVSEGSGFIEVIVLNKTGEACKVGIHTIDGEAKAKDDYHPVDTILEFSNGQATNSIKIGIVDDDDWEPDEDFYVELYQADDADKAKLDGEDTRTTITIIDDDKPGQIAFASNDVNVVAADKVARIRVVRTNGCDGLVTVDYRTTELEDKSHSAVAGQDFEHRSGTLEFQKSETEKIIEIPIIEREEEKRDEMFEIELTNISPKGAKLSKKNRCHVTIVIDIEGKKAADSLQKLLDMIQEKEKRSWGS